MLKMKPTCPRSIFALFFFAASGKSTNNLKRSAFSTLTHQHQVSGHHQRKQEEESRSVRISVWWDFENCNLPVNSNVFRVAQCITSAVREKGIKGPIQITAFGDVMQISRTNQEALSTTGINLTHVPSGGKNSADRSLLVDLMCWVSQNPPPAHLFLISGDRDFAGILHRLRMSNYNILLACPDSAPTLLCSAATIMWQWSSLLKGENLTGKLFNQPPDGPYNSWYGHYKAPLEDPFPVVEQCSSLPADESSEMKLRPIPKAVMKHIRQILTSYPEGIPISDLRRELAKSYLTIDKDLYGYRMFSRFLLAMPHILKLHSGNDGLSVVHSVNAKPFDGSIPAPYGELVTDNGESEVGTKVKENTRSTEDAGSSTSLQVLELKAQAQTTNMQEPGREEKQNGSSLSMIKGGTKGKACEKKLQDLKKEEMRKESTAKRSMQETREHDRKVKSQELPKKLEVAFHGTDIKDISAENGHQVPVHNDHISGSASEIGIFERIWMKWFEKKDKEKNFNGEDTVEKKNVKSSEVDESICPALFSPSSHEALIHASLSLSDDTVSCVSSQGSSSANQILNWFRSRGSLKLDDQVEKNSGTVDQEGGGSPVKLEMFSQESFWNELGSFIDTSPGATIFLQSMNRKQLIQNLQKQGIQSLRSLSDGDLHHLVELLISDKKWIEEGVFQAFPFRVIRSIGSNPHNNLTSGSNGLSHIFSERQSNSQESGEGKTQYPPHTGTTKLVTHGRGSSNKSRSEILADCHKLVDQIVHEYPKGFNMGSFRKLFLERHGYILDLQKLGYEKLVNLLQIMPGVIIESSLIVPAHMFKNLDTPVAGSRIGSSVSSSKEDDSDSDSPWYELGPVDNSISEKEGKVTRNQVVRAEQRTPDHEPLDENDFSDSEEETSSTNFQNGTKSKPSEESSLLQILGSWCGDGVGEATKNGSPNATDKTDTAEFHSSPSTLVVSYSKNEAPVRSPLRPQKPGKRYSFVSEQKADSDSKLVDGILDILKQSGEDHPRQSQ